MNQTRQPNTMILSAMIIVLCSIGFQNASMANPLQEQSESTESSTKEKIASGALTILYFPVKAAYAGLGGIVGGIAYVFGGGNKETAEVVWTPTIKGTYLITPEHLRGEKPIEFFGRPESEIPDHQMSH